MLLTIPFESLNFKKKKTMCEINAHLFENASLKFYNNLDENKLPAATSIVSKCSLTNCMGNFHSLNTSNSLRKEASSPSER